jgi:hypothetical protein
MGILRTALVIGGAGLIGYGIGVNAERNKGKPAPVASASASQNGFWERVAAASKASDEKRAQERKKTRSPTMQGKHPAYQTLEELKRSGGRVIQVDLNGRETYVAMPGWDPAKAQKRLETQMAEEQKYKRYKDQVKLREEAEIKRYRERMKNWNK